MKRVLGLGNALTDILLQVSEGDLREIGFPKGSMNLINAEQLEQIQKRFISVRKHLVAGGSASNTVATIAQLGGKAAFIGKIGCDEVGSFYREDLIKNNVKPLLLTSSLMSGCCIVLITPDGERTFCTYLGAAADLHAEDIRKVNLDGGVIICVGNEGSGLSQAAIDACDAAVTIPMLGRAESFNASAAAAILAWELMR